jgi:hypothetical protein
VEGVTSSGEDVGRQLVETGVCSLTGLSKALTDITSLRDETGDIGGMLTKVLIDIASR